VTDPQPSVRTGRRSACAAASREAELEHLRRMSMLERMALALELGRRCRLIAELAREGRKA
jgi:hypothetical protein